MKAFIIEIKMRCKNGQPYSNRIVRQQTQTKEKKFKTVDIKRTLEIALKKKGSVKSSKWIKYTEEKCKKKG